MYVDLNVFKLVRYLKDTQAKVGLIKGPVHQIQALSHVYTLICPDEQGDIYLEECL